MNFKKIITMIIVLVCLYLVLVPYAAYIKENYSRVDTYFMLKNSLYITLGIILATNFNKLHLKNVLVKVSIILISLILNLVSLYLLFYINQQLVIALLIIFGYVLSIIIDKVFNNLEKSNI